MKNKFIEELREYLEDKDVSKNQIDEIIADYQEFYEEYSNRGLSEEEIIERLGRPRTIYKNIRNTVITIKEETWKSKAIAVSPFISVLAFVLIGYFTKVWHPTWLVFLFVPLSGVMFSGKNLLNTLLGMSPFLTTATYILIGHFFNVWHPTWLIFLLIPILGVLTDKESFKNKVAGLSVFIGIIAAFLVTYFGILEWKYAWLFFLLVILSTPLFRDKNKPKEIIFFISAITAIILYIVLVFSKVTIPLALCSFFIPLVIGIWTDHINVTIEIDKSKKTILFTMLSVLIIAAFVVLGVIFKNWIYIWQVLLLIPIFAVVIESSQKNKFRMTSITPFIALALFFSFGYFYAAWQISWLAFLLIPIIGVLEGESKIIESKREKIKD
ncbi:HAAS signaling domain-containing protein [Haploplasma axanthum]|nr:DUF1700 domain-containing protein [Haploplasma axanthum]